MNLIKKIIIGKNAPAWGRAIVQVIVGAILASVLYANLPEGADFPVPLDPALVEAGDAVHVPQDQVEDGLTVDEGMKLLMAFILLWVSRFVSYVRARNLGWLADSIGWLIGRSIPSLLRTGADVLAGFFGYIGFVNFGDPGAADLGAIIGAIILYVFSRISSATEDQKRNPVITG